jgi:hypothetical protein
MRKKLPGLLAVLLNLTVWNFVLSGSWGGFFSSAYFVLLHGIISGTTLLFLWLLAIQFRRSGKPAALLLLSILFAFLPPALTLWLAYAIPQLMQLKFAGLDTLLLVAVWVIALDWYIWVLLGVANYFLLRLHSNQAELLTGTTNRQL